MRTAVVACRPPADISLVLSSFSLDDRSIAGVAAAATQQRMLQQQCCCGHRRSRRGWRSTNLKESHRTYLLMEHHYVGSGGGVRTPQTGSELLYSYGIQKENIRQKQIVPKNK